MSLKDIRGQDRAVEILRNAIAQERLAHAWLFLGPEGVGKTKTALEFAKLINCKENKSDPCDSCDICIKIHPAPAGRDGVPRLIHPDIFLISKDKDVRDITILKIRELQHRFSLKAFEARYKIGIIVQAEAMNEEASNCLLKMLEEPSSDTIFILTCQNERELPKTIVSRCQIIRFRPLAREEVNDILVKDFSIKEEDAKFLSVLSGSNMKKALILKEKDAVKRKNDIIDGFASFKQNTDFMAKSKKDELLQAMDIVLGFYRDLLVYKFTKDQNLIMNIDRLNEIIELTDAMKPDRIQDGINSIEYAKSALRSNANTKLTIKVLQERLAV